MTLSPYAAPGIIQAGTNLSMSLIEEKVSEAFQLTVHEVHSKSRAGNKPLCRQITTLLALELLHLTYRELGAFYGKDHTTAMHSVQKAKDRIDTEPELAEKYERIKMRILLLPYGKN